MPLPRIFLIHDGSLHLGPRLAAHFGVVVVPTFETAWQLAQHESVDLILVHHQERALSFCRSVRQNTRFETVSLVVIIPENVSVRSNSEQLRTDYYTAEVDDVVTLPISTPELIARLATRLLWLRKRRSNLQVETLGSLTLSFDRMEFKVGNQLLHLSHYELALLQLFVRSVDRVLTREEIRLRVWKESHVTSRTIDTHVYFLRKKLKDYEFEIMTVHGFGYVLRRRGDGRSVGDAPETS